MARIVETVELAESTVLAFDAYVREAEAAIGQAGRGEVPFLWSDGSPERMRALRGGKTIAELWAGDRPVKVPDGLIHDWIGATRVCAVSVGDILAVVQDYDNHKTIYKPEVMDSGLIQRAGNDFQIYLRLLEKKVITVILDTYHDVHYFPVNPLRWCCRSFTTRISEVENAGKPGEFHRLPGTGYGFLWRLRSYWRFEEREGGVDVECRAISLTRDIPKGLGWIIEPMVMKLPRDSLRATLEATRKAFSRPKPATP